MTKRHFIALASAIKEHNRIAGARSRRELFTPAQLSTIARFCASQNYHFDFGRWVGYIAGENGPCGGKVTEKGATR